MKYLIFLAALLGACDPDRQKPDFQSIASDSADNRIDGSDGSVLDVELSEDSNNPVQLIAGFCRSLPDITIPGDGFVDELGVICKDQKPLSTVTLLLENAYQGDGSVKLLEMENKDEANNISLIFFAFAVRYPVSAEAFQQQMIPDLNYLGANKDNLQIVLTKVNDIPSKGGGHIGGEIYHTDSQSVILGTTITSSFDSEFNAWQVLEGNSNIYLNTHHMTEPLPTQPKSNRIFLVVQDGEGASYSISISYIRIDNAGLGQIVRDNVRTGLQDAVIDAYNYVLSQ